MGEDVGGVAAGQLRAIVERIERLEDEKREVAGQIREVYGEAKGNGFDVKAIRKIVAMRRVDAQQRAEEAAVLETYMAALGMLADTPLGQAAASTLRRAGRSGVEMRDTVADRVEAAFAGVPGATVTRGRKPREARADA